LKHERAKLRKRLGRLEKARAELEQASIRLGEIEAEQRLLDDDRAARLSEWVRGGCTGPQPEPDRARLANLTKQQEAAQATVGASAGPIAVIDSQMATLRQRLAAADVQIASEIAAVLAGELDAKLADVQIAADALNAGLANVMGLRAFAFKHGGNYAFSQLAQKISALKTPEIGATRAETEAAEEQWQHKFDELTR
jgi:sugar/nucleoside kinase (ribokinase family)